MTQSSEGKQVCVIGLGNMGSVLAEALLAEHHGVTVWNRISSKCGPLVEAGATAPAHDPRAAAYLLAARSGTGLAADDTRSRMLAASPGGTLRQAHGAGPPSRVRRVEPAPRPITASNTAQTTARAKGNPLGPATSIAPPATTGPMTPPVV